MAARWPANFYIFLLLFVSIGGAVELARSRNKVHAKNRKISFSRNFCSAIYTYSTVCVLAFRKCIIYYNPTTGSIYLDCVKFGEETTKSAVFKMVDLKK